MRLNTLFRKFKQQKIHMAIVKNTIGEVIGVVTMSDVLDALFEDFYAEEHEAPQTIRTSS
jgi:CBS domain containing-hemolysin-like protein